MIVLLTLVIHCTSGSGSSLNYSQTDLILTSNQILPFHVVINFYLTKMIKLLTKLL